MEENIKKATQWLKEQPVKGCITGSTMLGYFPGENQDIDLFIYDEKSFTKIFYAMKYNPMFQILDPLEHWKCDQHMDVNRSSFDKRGLTTIKYKYNLEVDVNIILKRSCTDIFSVISSFDMDIICKGYDIQTNQYLDLTNGSQDTKVANWNKWNTSFYSGEVWQISRILRQLERCFKYHRRGYNTDPMVLKYISMIDELQKFTDIFHSERYSHRLEVTKKNTKIVKKICEVWLESHIITDEEIELIREKIKQI